MLRLNGLPSLCVCVCVVFNYAKVHILHNFYVFVLFASLNKIQSGMTLIKTGVCEFHLQINGFQQTIIFKPPQQQQQLYRLHRRRFQRNELLSSLAKSHRRQRNMWTRLVRRWQLKRHTLKVSDLYQSLSILFHLNKSQQSLALRSHAVNQEDVLQTRWSEEKKKSKASFKSIFELIYSITRRVSVFRIVRALQQQRCCCRNLRFFFLLLWSGRA